MHAANINLRREFNQALEKSPSIIILDEFDALACNRNANPQKGEEITTLLNMIEETVNKHRLVIAMTNRIETIDLAFIRSGRFEYKFQVPCPPSFENFCDAFESSLDNYPRDVNIDLRLIKKMKRRLLSDAAWLANETKKTMDNLRKSKIDNECLKKAITNLNKHISDNSGEDYYNLNITIDDEDDEDTS